MKLNMPAQESCLPSRSASHSSTDRKRRAKRNVQNILRGTAQEYEGLLKPPMDTTLMALSQHPTVSTIYVSRSGRHELAWRAVCCVFVFHFAAAISYHMNHLSTSNHDIDCRLWFCCHSSQTVIDSFRPPSPALIRTWKDPETEDPRYIYADMLIGFLFYVARSIGRGASAMNARPSISSSTHLRTRVRFL